MRRLGPDLAIVSALAALFLALFHNLPSHQPYMYDEADYVSASTKGLVANILERPSMSIAEFLKIGLDRNKQANRAGLSDIVRASHDVTFYRHYHGPLYFYWLAAIGPLVHFDEYAMRASGLCWHILTFALIYFGVLLLSSSRIAALIAGCLFLFGQSNISTDIQITPHISYVCFTISTLLVFARYIQNGNVAIWYASVVLFAAAFCSVEYALLLPIAFACTFAISPNRRPPARVLVRSAILFSCCLIMLWPLGLLELSALKGYISISYLATQRTGVYGDGTPLGIWLRHFSDSPVEYIVLLAGTALFTLSLARRRAPLFLAPLLAYAVLMLLTTLKNRSLSATYISSILPPLFVVSGMAIASALKGLRPVYSIFATAVVLISVGLGGYALLLRQAAQPMYRPEQGIIAAIRGNRMERSNVLVPSDFLPAISYYFPQMIIHGYLKNDTSAALLNKFRIYDSRVIIGGEDLLLNQLVIDRIRIDIVPVPKAAGYSIIHVDGHI